MRTTREHPNIPSPVGSPPDGLPMHSERRHPLLLLSIALLLLTMLAARNFTPW